MTLTALQDLLKEMGLGFYCDAENDRLMLICRTEDRSVRVVLQLDDVGETLQMQGHGFVDVPADAASSMALFDELLAINYETKYVSLGRNGVGGEVLCTHELFCGDGVLTPQRLAFRLGCFCIAVADAQRRLEIVARTSKTTRERMIEELFDSSIEEFRSRGLGDQSLGEHA